MLHFGPGAVPIEDTTMLSAAEVLEVSFGSQRRGSFHSSKTWMSGLYPKTKISHRIPY